MKEQKTLLAKVLDLKQHIGKVSKDANNPFFKSKYMDLATLLEAVEPLLQERGLLLTQPINNGKVFTDITDVNSGESMDSGIELPPLTDPQKIGSCITYFRRYTLKSLLAIQEEDDDGNKASQPTPKPTRLTTEDFTYLMEKGTKAEIKTALETRAMETEQKEKLTLKLK